VENYEDLIKELELTFKVDAITYDSVCLWPLIRIMLFYHGRVENSEDIVTVRRSRQSLKSRFGDLLWALQYYKKQRRDLSILHEKEAFINNSDKEGEEVIKPITFLFFCLQSHRGQIRDGRYMNMFLDPSFLAGSLFFEADISLTKKRIWNNLCHLFNAKKEEKVEFFEDFKKALPLPLQSTIFFDDKILIREARKVFAYQKVFENIFQEFKPKVVVQAAFYNIHGLALNLACSKLKINSVDMQHGVLEPMAYAGYDSSRVSRYAMLPKYYWLWDMDSFQTVFNSIGDEKRLIIGGNIWMKKEITSDDYDLDLAEDFSSVKSNYKKTILVSLQSYQHSSLPDFVFDAIASDTTVFWLLRIHPRCETKEIDALILILKEKNLENCEINFATKLPLKYLMRHIDLHITRFSSVAIDVAMMDIPTVFIDDVAIRLYARDYSVLWNSGLIAVALDKQALRQAILDIWNKNRICTLENYFGNEDYQKSIHRLLN
jgi:hypothetical protein